MENQNTQAVTQRGCELEEEEEERVKEQEEDREEQEEQEEDFFELLQVCSEACDGESTSSSDSDQIDDLNEAYEEFIDMFDDNISTMNSAIRLLRYSRHVFSRHIELCEVMDEQSKNFHRLIIEDHQEVSEKCLDVLGACVEVKKAFLKVLDDVSIIHPDQRNQTSCGTLRLLDLDIKSLEKQGKYIEVIRGELIKRRQEDIAHLEAKLSRQGEPAAKETSAGTDSSEGGGGGGGGEGALQSRSKEEERLQEES